jgi:hypothetical protein
MRNILLPFILFIANVSNNTLFSQSTLNGVVTIQNSYFNSKTKIDYVPNAQVEGSYVRTKPTTTDVNGAFKLLIISAKSKEKVRLKIVKDGYQVVNQNALFAYVDQADTVQVFMAKTEDLEAARTAYFKGIKAASESAFQAKIKLLNAELAALRNKKTVDESRVLVVENQFKNLCQQSRKIEDIAHKLAINYSSINLDDASLEGQKAFAFFQKNAIDSALMVFEKGELKTKMDFLQKEKKDRIRKDVKEIDSKIEHQCQRIWTDLSVQADFYQLNWEIEKADSMYQLMLKFDSTNVFIYKRYAVFLEEINELNRAKAVCERGISHVKFSSDEIELMDQLGNLHSTLGDFKDAEKILTQATDIAEWEIINRKDIYEPLYALTQMHLGQLFTKMKNYKMAESYLTTAWKYHQECALKPLANTKDSLLLATNFYSIAVNHQYQNNEEQCLIFYAKTDSIHNKIFDPNSTIYKLSKADLKNKFSELYLAKKDTLNALKYLLEYTNIYESLNPLAFEDDYLAGLIRQKEMHLSTKNYQKAVGVLETLSIVQKRRVLEHPLHYEMDFEKTLTALGNYHWQQKNYVLADSMFKMTAELYKTIVKGTPLYMESNGIPKIGRPEICAFYSRMGSFYKEQNNVELAENQYVKSAELWRELSQKEPLIYGEKLLKNLQTIISLHDTLMLSEIFEKKLKAHKDIQNTYRNEMVEVQNKIVAAYTQSTTIKDKQAKLNDAYGNLAAYYLSLNKIKEAELVAQKQENNAAEFLIFIYGVQEKFKEAQSVFAKIGDKKAAKTHCTQWANDFYNQRIISYSIKAKINKWLESSTAIGLLGN